MDIKRKELDMEHRDTAASFARNLKNRRTELGMTQRELADLICYSEKSVSKWESGTVIAPSSILLRLSEVLSCDVDSLLRGSEAPCYYLGVDGGGTKTEFLLCDAQGNRISHLILGASNPVDVGMEAAQAVLSEGILNACRSVSPRRVSAFVGIAGGITGDNKATVRRFLERYRFAHVDNGSDSQNAVAAALGEEDGTVTIIGTGIVSFAQRNGRLRRIGGLGYLLEDGGSGYMIGRDGILAALKDEMGQAPSTALTELVRRRAEGESVLEKLSDFYSGGKRLIASYAPLVFDAFESGDRTAEAILDKNAREIVSYFLDADCRPAKRVTLVGGLTKRKNILLPMIKKYLPNADCDIRTYEKPLVYGALRLAGLENVKDS